MTNFEKNLICSMTQYLKNILQRNPKVLKFEVPKMGEEITRIDCLLLKKMEKENDS